MEDHKGEREMRKANVAFTIREYMNLPELPNYELIGGELLLTPSPSVLHQRIVRNLQRAFDHWLRERNLGEVLAAPLDVILSTYTVVQPDLIVIFERRRDIIHEKIEGAPDLVVEVLSPATSERDLTLKHRLYARHGVSEYWIADPEAQTVRVFRWTQEGYVTHGTFSDGDTIDSPLLQGIHIPLVHVFPVDAQ